MVIRHGTNTDACSGPGGRCRLLNGHPPTLGCWTGRAAQTPACGTSSGTATATISYYLCRRQYWLWPGSGNDKLSDGWALRSPNSVSRDSGSRAVFPTTPQTFWSACVWLVHVGLAQASSDSGVPTTTAIPPYRVRAGGDDQGEVVPQGDDRDHRSAHYQHPDCEDVIAGNVGGQGRSPGDRHQGRRPEDAALPGEAQPAR